MVRRRAAPAGKTRAGRPECAAGFWADSRPVRGRFAAGMRPECGRFAAGMRARDYGTGGTGPDRSRRSERSRWSDRSRWCGIAISSGFWRATVRAGEGMRMPSAR
ncbi:hypothetical protein SAMN05428945_4089 [Streptomyces sp. 2224.1]|nr:hypothetical protein BX261_1248 [Streptomyces sp. 2321.6]SDR55324.1 hypothetical protein SAMN05216511_5968 [Streptomyces sp. KS_16]SEC12547.1 hypothetical protein SAMN05428940_1247 [Streptomyces sp. 2133.1]SED18056.1 hypothetical protein SAMN05428945_4089 [Streptomyces sp. 2224.1]SNC65090.1 hypothetical protein SAMN06272741_1246 [Streptomyces sp. 2114.4]